MHGHKAMAGPCISILETAVHVLKIPLPYTHTQEAAAAPLESLL